MTDKLKELLRDELAYGGQPISCQLGMVARCICEDCRSVRIGYALSEPAVGAADIEVVAYYSGEKFYASTESASCDMAGPVRAVMYVDDHRRILAGVNQQAGSGVPEGWRPVPLEPTPEMVNVLLQKLIVTNRGNILNPKSVLLDVILAAPLPPSPAAKAVPNE